MQKLLCKNYCKQFERRYDNNKKCCNKMIGFKQNMLFTV